jgi:flavin-dependent dehydrogenase
LPEKKFNMAHDVTVIGGGPAGSAAAIRLARSGRRVCLYEKSHFPRAKLCGGFLSSEGLTDLDDLEVLAPLRRAGAVSLHRTVVASTSGMTIETALPQEALSVSRDILDDLLLQKARQAGVDVQEGVDGLSQTEKTPYKVIATGRLGFLRENLSRLELTPWYASPSIPYFGIQALFENVQGVTDQVELDLVESGYVGLARQRNGINVCALTTQKTLERWGPSLDNVMAHFADENPVLQAHLKEAKRIGSWITVGPVRLGIRQLAHDHTFYIGDAACVVDPFAGEGMSIGLYSSNLLVRALDRKDSSPMKTYAALWREAFVPALRWNASMRALYAMPLLREPILQALAWFPQGMNWLTELTRYRKVELS